MLRLTRRPEESIVITTPLGLVIIKVVEIRDRKVRLGITAPQEIPVHRQEVWEMIHRPQQTTPVTAT